jgi:hypothetical protein
VLSLRLYLEDGEMGRRLRLAAGCRLLAAAATAAPAATTATTTTASDKSEQTGGGTFRKDDAAEPAQPLPLVQS